MTSALPPETAGRYARIAGFLYLIIFFGAGFAEGFVRGGLVAPGDAAATAANIAANPFLFRLGFASDLIAFAADLGVTVLFFLLLRPVSPVLSLVAAAFRLVGHPAIASINMLNHYAALQTAQGAGFFSAFGAEQLNQLTLFFMGLHKYGYLIAGVFFGIHLLLLGYLIYRSELFPGVFGILLAVAGGGYVIESFGTILHPAGGAFYTMVVAFTAVLGELGFTAWLLIKGARSSATRSAPQKP